MTNRLTSHDKKAQAEMPTVRDFSRYKVCNSYSNPITNTPVSGSGEGECRRLSQKRLMELETVLGKRDKEVLLAIQRHRYLLTGQVQRLIFTDAATATAALTG